MEESSGLDCQDATMVSKRKLKPPLRTYSKRKAFQDIEASQKRQKTEIREVFTEIASPNHNIAVQAVIKRKKNISDYFSTVSSSSPNSTSLGSIFSSDSIHENSLSPPSSPLHLPSHSSPKIGRKRPLKRRVLARKNPPPLAMSNADRVTQVTHSDESVPRPEQESTQATDGPQQTIKDETIIEANPLPTGEDMGYENMFFLDEEQPPTEPHLENRHGSDNLSSSSNESSESLAVAGAPHQHGALQIRVGGGAHGVLIQSTLALGQIVARECSLCGMVYNRTDPEDVRSHDIKHENAMRGISIDPVRNRITIKWLHLWDDDHFEHYVTAVEYNHHSSLKSWCQTILDLVDSELGCLPIPHDQLWDSRPNPLGNIMGTTLAQGLTEQETHTLARTNEMRFKVFLYIKNKRVVGCLVAEIIKNGYEYACDQADSDSDGDWPSIVENLVPAPRYDAPHDAYMGVNKIWVHRFHRREHIASMLLDTARKNFWVGRPLSREEIAFTLPTEPGSHFAETYMSEGDEGDLERGYLWLHYDE